MNGSEFPVMGIELHREDRGVAEGPANRTVLQRTEQKCYSVLEGDYLVKVFFKWGKKKIFTGSTVLHLVKDTKVNVFCTWERTIKFLFLDQNGQGIAGIHCWLSNKDGVLYDENMTQENGEVIMKAPFNGKDPYLLHAEYKDVIVFDEKLQKTLRRLNSQVTLNLYDFTVVITDALELPPGVDLTPLLITSEGNNTIQITPKKNREGSYIFEDVPEGDYHLQISFGEYIDDVHVTIPNAGTVIEMKFSALFNLVIDLFDSKGNTLVNEDIEFTIFRDNQTIAKTKQKTISLPPARYVINAYLDNQLIGVKPVELTNDKHLTFVTTIDSIFPLILSLLFYALFGFFVILTILRKFSLSSLLKSLAILLVILSFFQPWWLFTGTSDTVPEEKTTALYVNPGMMIETRTSYGEVSLNLAEIPDIFLLFLGWIVPLALLACASIAIGIVLRRTQKKKYAFLLSVVGVVLFGVLVPSFFYGTTRLIDTSLGSVQGDEVLVVSMGPEEIMMQTSWGFSSGFYLVSIALLVAVIAVLLDIRARFMLKKKL